MNNPLRVSFKNSALHLYKFDSIESTNTYLRDSWQDFSDYSVVWAEKQSSGKGRFMRSWNSIPHKDLTFSLLIPVKDIPLSILPTITQIAALTLSEQVEARGLQPQIKWPNDVLIHGKKLSGILCEPVQNNSRTGAILGVGININSTATDLACIDQPATSLFNELRVPIDRDLFFFDFLESFYKSFLTFTQNGFLPFLDKIKQRLALLNEPVTVVSGNSTIQGKMIGLNSDGTIAFQRGNGEIVDLVSGEVSIRK